MQSKATAKDLTQRTQRKGGEHRESGRDPSAGLRQRRRPQDDDAHRIVRKLERTAGSACLPQAGLRHVANREIGVPRARG